MRTSSTRLRMGAALAVTTLGLFSLGGSAFAGESSGKGADRRADRTENKTAPITETEDTDSNDGTANNVPDAGDNMHPSGKDRSVEHGGSGTQGKSQSDPDGSSNGGADKPGMPGGDDLADQDGNNGCGNDDDFEDDNNGNCGGRRKKASAPPAPPVVGGSGQVTCPKGSTMPADGTSEKDCVKDVTCPNGESMPAGGTDEDDCVKADAAVTTEVLGGTLTGGTVAPGAVLGTQLQNEAAGEAVETRVLGVSVERGAAAETAAAAGGTGTSVLGASFARGGVLARTGFGLTLAGLVGLALVLVGAGLAKAGRREHGPLA